MRVGLVTYRGRVVWPLLSVISYKKKPFRFHPLWWCPNHTGFASHVFSLLLREQTPPLRVRYDASLSAFGQNMQTLYDETPKQSTIFLHPLKRMLYLKLHRSFRVVRRQYPWVQGLLRSHVEEDVRDSILGYKDSSVPTYRKLYSRRRNKVLDNIAVSVNDRLRRLSSWSCEKLKLI